MAAFCSLYSSSSGNCTYIGTSSGGILIDAGVSAKRITQALADIGVEPSGIRAIFVTHEHSDHINGIRVFASRNHIGVYASEGTLIGMDRCGVFTSPVDAYIVPGSGMEYGGMFVRPFRISHDANEPTGYTVVTEDGKRIAVATDTGTVTDETREALSGCDLVLLESNHDLNMLKMGPYPYMLKERILSDRGHLSNDSCAEFSRELVSGGTSRLVLGHLSKENNIPSLAFETTRYALGEAGCELNRDYLLTVAGDLNEPIKF